MPFFSSLGATFGRLLIVVIAIVSATISTVSVLVDETIRFKGMGNLTIDSAGNVYLVEINNNSIRKITPTGVATTIAGNGTLGSSDGTGTNATFEYPNSVALDSVGNVYVSEYRKIRKITPAGVVTSFAGTGLLAYNDGTGTNAGFRSLGGITFDSSGNLYVTDVTRIRKITPAGVVTTLAGGLNPGSLNGTGTNASFNAPYGVTVDSAGNIYVADTGNNIIRKITPTGVVTTIAGQTTSGFLDGTGTNTRFYSPRGIALDSNGNLYVADTSNNRIRKITPAAVVTTFSGSGISAYSDGLGASHGSPTGLTIDSSGNLYVAEGSPYENHRIRKITPAGVVSTFAGGGGGGGISSSGLIPFNGVTGVTADFLGNLFIVEKNNNCVRMLNSKGILMLILGSLTGLSGPNSGGSDINAIFNSPNTVIITTNQSMYVSDELNNIVSRFISIAPPYWNNNTYYVGFNAPSGLTSDLLNNVYVADTGNHRIRKITDAGVVSTFAGTGSSGSSDGTGTNASFNSPSGLIIDTYGNIYVADTGNHRIRKITPAGVVTTIAGSSSGFADGIGTNARFNSPYHISIDPLGTLYVADRGNHLIRKIQTSTNVVTSFAGNGTIGFTPSSLNSPSGITVDNFRNAYVGDTGNNSIRKIENAYTLPENNAVVTTFAGSTGGFLNGTTMNALFSAPHGIAIDSVGNIYVAESTRIRKITPAGVVTTLAGSGSSTFADGTGTNASFSGSCRGMVVDSLGLVYVAATGSNCIRMLNGPTVTTIAGSGTLAAGFLDGTGTNARFNLPSGIAIDREGNVYIADTNNHRIRKITRTRVVTTIAGQTTAGFLDGTGTNARFSSPQGVAVDSNGNVYVADTGNHRIRKIAPGNVVTTFAGSSVGFLDATGTNAQFSSPVKIIFDSSGNLYVSDNNNFRIRKITPDGVVSTLAGDGFFANLNGIGTNAKIGDLNDIMIDQMRNIYLTNTAFHRIRKIGNTAVQIPLQSGIVSTFAGNGTTTFGNGTGTNATFNIPKSVALDLDGNLYVADQYNHQIRKITPGGVVSTLAGSGVDGFANGSSTVARFSYPFGIAVDREGNVYVGDTNNSSVRKITPAGVVSTLAGGGSLGQTGALGYVDGTGTNARFRYTYGLLVDSNGNVFVCDDSNHCIRKITAAGVVSTFAGIGNATTIDATAEYVDATGTSARFRYPESIALDSIGNMYVADLFNHRIRKITPSAVVTTFAGNGDRGSTDGIGTNASFNEPYGVTVDSADNVYVGDSQNHRIRKITPAGVVTTLAGSSQSFADGTGTNASFNIPIGLTVAPDGTLYVADRNNHRIRKII